MHLRFRFFGNDQHVSVAERTDIKEREYELVFVDAMTWNSAREDLGEDSHAQASVLSVLHWLDCEGASESRSLHPSSQPSTLRCEITARANSYGKSPRN